MREVGNIWAAQEHLGLEAIRDVEDQIGASDERDSQIPFSSLTDAILGSGQRPSHRAALKALARFGRPEQDSRRETLTWGLYYLKSALADKTRRKDYLAKLTRPGGLKALRDFHMRRRNMTR